MTTRGEFIAEARAWLDTPFKWQASLKGVGADCKGLVWGVARELRMPEAKSLYAAISNYGGRVPTALLKRGLSETLAETDGNEDGDILLLVTGSPPKPQHLGIRSGDRLIHTYNAGPRRVISSPLAAALRAWPLDSAWRFASLEA